MVKEILYKDSVHNSSDSFWWMKRYIINDIKEIFRRNLKNNEIINYATENRRDGKVIVNYTNKDQKYILGIDPNDKKLMFITDNLPHHISIKRKYIPNWFCLWWWRLMFDNKNKAISLYWKSRVYGGIAWKEKEAMLSLLKNFYPDYRINHDN